MNGYSEKKWEKNLGEGSGKISPLSSSASVRIENMLRDKLTTSDNEHWLPSLSFSLSPEQKNTLIIHLPHELFFRWYSSTGRRALENTAREILGRELHIQYEWPGKIHLEKKTAISGSSFSSSPISSFDDFISGGKNKEGVQILRKSLHKSPCTILLHGPSGSGKSHLLLASASELSSSLPGKVAFLSGRELISLFSRSPELAHKALAACSAIIADDIQLLEKHISIQQELTLFLDGLKDTFFITAYQTDGHDESGQKLLPMLYDRLCSHLSIGIAEPDMDVRLRFTQKAMDNIGLPEHRGTALFLARRCLRLRHIRGVLEHILHRYEQNGILPSLDETSSILLRAGSPQPVDTDSILSVVASRYGCTPSQLCEKKKDVRLTLPRQIAMYLCRELLGESYPSLGLIFGGKDHSTVMHAIRKIEKMRVTNKDMHIQLTELTKQCRNSQPGSWN